MTGRRRAWWVAVLVIAAVGCLGRAWNLDFDARQHLHPDERHWALTASSLAAAPQLPAHGTLVGPLLDWLDAERSPANPYRAVDSFVYGPATLAAGRSLAGWLHRGAVTGDQPAAFVVEAIDAIGIPLLDAAGDARFDDRYQVDLVGRLLGVVVDTLAIVVIALAGRRIGGAAVGLAAAAVHAGSVLAIQHAHYFGSEPTLTLAAAVALYVTVGIDRSARVGPALRGGLAVGLAAGATVAVKLSGVASAAVALGAVVVLAVIHRRRADVVRVIAAAVGALVAVRVLLPGAFVGLGLRPATQFVDDVRRARQLAFADLPPSIQWAGRVPVLEVSGWLLRSTIGPGTVVAALAGIAALWRHRHRVGRFGVAVVVASVVVPWLAVVRGPVTTGRYFVPLLPALAVAAGYGFVAAVRVVPTLRPALSRALAAALAVTALAAAVWPLALVSGVYGNVNTRIAASRWIAEHVPAGARLTVEAWDDALPLAVDGIDRDAYELVTLELFGPDSPHKIATVAEQLVDVDYVIESSPRVWNSVGRLPARFPSTLAFFTGLDDGRLGFERVASFASPPRLGPLRLDSNAVEEAFSVYDHPEVRIWERRRPLTVAATLAALDPQAAATAVPLVPADGASNGGRLRPSAVAANALAPTFARTFATDGPAAVAPLVLLGWTLIVALVGLACWVLLLPVFARLPDAGAGIAPLLGLLVVVATTVVAVGAGGLALGQGLVSAATATLIAAGAVATWWRRDAIVAVWRRGRAAVLGAVGACVAGGLVATLLRAANPDLWHVHRGGEKPFELAMLTAVLRGRTLPPPDLWFSGGALNYYYGGSLLVATPARLLRTAPELAFNLGVGLVGALLAGAAFSAGAAVWSLGAVARARSGSRDGDDRRAVLAGVLGAAFVIAVPNVATAVVAVRRLVGADGRPFDWWGLSRVIPGRPIVTEFPAWSLLFGDLHAHVIGLPVMLTLLTVLVAWIGGVAAARDGTGGEEGAATVARLLVAGGVAGLVAGAVRSVNIWDVPVAAVLVGTTALVSIVLVRRHRWCGAPAVVAGGVAAMVMAVLPWAPLTRRLAVSGVGIEIVIDPTPLASAARQFGLWAAITVVGGALALAPTVAPMRARWRREQRRRRPVVVAAIAAVTVVMGAICVAAVVTDRMVLLIAVTLAGAAAAAALAVRPGAIVGPAALGVSALGWAAVAAIEVVSVADDLDRMNTVFKGWFQAWALLAVGSAGIVASAWRGAARRTGAAIVVVAAAMVVAFVAFAVPARLDDRVSAGGPTLDGLGYLDAGRTIEDAGVAFDPGEDRPLIDWLRGEVVGFPTIAEAPGRGYAWTSRVATLTGLPTVLGWPYHLSQQRPMDAATIAARERDLVTLYGGAGPAALDVLWRYDIRYVVFGTAERVLLGRIEGSSVAALRALPCTVEVFADAATFVLAVDQPCVADELAARRMTN